MSFTCAVGRGVKCCYASDVHAGREFVIAVYSRLEGFDACRQLGGAECLNETLATSVPDGHVCRAGGQL